MHHSYPGSSITFDDFCIQTRIITACSLLEELHEYELLNDLLQNREAMQKLALRRLDTLNAWERQHA